jgi:hypothetical protein
VGECERKLKDNKQIYNNARHAHCRILVTSVTYKHKRHTCNHIKFRRTEVMAVLSLVDRVWGSVVVIVFFRPTLELPLMGYIYNANIDCSWCSHPTKLRVISV